MSVRERLSILLADMAKGPAASAADIERVETTLDVSLPEDYKEFLRYTNGASGRLGKQERLELFTADENDLLATTYRSRKLEVSSRASRLLHVVFIADKLLHAGSVPG